MVGLVDEGEDSGTERTEIISDATSVFGPTITERSRRPTRDTWQYASDGLTCHDGLHILLPSEARNKGKHSVLTETSGQARHKDHTQDKGQVSPSLDITEEACRKRKQGENDKVEHKRPDYALRIRCCRLKFRENDHGSQVGYRGDGKYGRLKVIEYPCFGVESFLEIWTCRKEHIPTQQSALSYYGYVPK